MTITFACGRSQEATGNENPPRCAHCGTTRVDAVKAPRPKFRGVVRGPLAEFTDLPALPVTLRS